MDNTTIMVIAVVAALVVLAVVWMVMQQRRRAHLKDRFGPEYDQALRQHNDPRAAERELLDRERRVAAYSIKPLTRDDASRFTEAWRSIQARIYPSGARAAAAGSPSRRWRARAARRRRRPP